MAKGRYHQVKNLQKQVTDLQDAMLEQSRLLREGVDKGGDGSDAGL